MEFVWPNHMEEFSIEKHTIILGLAGSKSYGTNHPKSDTDWKGVLIPPKRYFLSPFANFEQTQWRSDEKSGRVSERDGLAEADEEGTIFGIDKFFKLASACNPNVVELLFVDEEHFAKVSPAGRMLIESRELFLSERALYTFTGYAKSQLKRIRTHKSWIDNPPEVPPTREEFGLPPEKVMPHDQLQAARKFVSNNLTAFAPWLLEQGNEHKEAFWEGVYNVIVLMAEKNGIQISEVDSWLEIEELAEDSVAEILGYDSNFMEYLRREKAYSQKSRHYKQYKSWVKNRNPARAEIEARYGYDCKHAMHLVRLLRMGEEILTTGTMQVYRPDREELLQIRNGAWTYDELVEWGDRKSEELNDLVSSGNSVVPKKPPIKKLEKLCLDVKEVFYERIS